MVVDRRGHSPSIAMLTSVKLKFMDTWVCITGRRRHLIRRPTLS